MKASNIAETATRKSLPGWHDMNIVNCRRWKCRSCARVRRNKNDAADAAAICEAVRRPSMRPSARCNSSSLKDHSRRQLLATARIAASRVAA
jgi:hypothetical protein